MITVIPTVDVEGVHGLDPFEHLVLGNIGEREGWGVFRQAEIFSKYDVSATFFIDVYEYTMWGEVKLRDVCERLIELGQDVQLHTHPGWRNNDDRDSPWLKKIKTESSYLGPHKDFMAKLSYDEQCAVLQHGSELLEKWIGEKPIAHRSGGYSINDDTLRALKDVGIPIDSSMNAAHENSEVCWTYNAIEERDGVIELPVTVGRYIRHLGGGRIRYPVYKRLMKTDHSILNAYEVRAYVNDAQKKGLKLLNLFLHSYSLMDGGYDWSRPKPSQEASDNLEDILAVLTQAPNVEFMSCAQFHSKYQEEPERFYGPDNVPDMPLSWRKMVKYGVRRMRRA